MTKSDSIFFYDEKCKFCVFATIFLVKNTKKELKFCALQDEFTYSFFKQKKLATPDLGSALLWKEGKLYKASDAVLIALMFAKNPWRYLKFLQMFPKFLRDFFYFCVARLRKWILVHNNYTLSKEERNRFISSRNPTSLVIF